MADATKNEAEPVALTDDAIRAWATENRVYTRESASVPDVVNGGWKHPFHVTISGDQLRQLVALAHPSDAESLRAEVERLTEQRDCAVDGWSKTQDKWIAALERAEKAEAERDKWFEGAGAHHVASMREAQRADQNAVRATTAEAERDAALARVAELEADSFQSRVDPWMQACFGPLISADRLERGDRLLEEVLELLQSGDYPRERIAALTGYVWDRPAGEPEQEVGGVMVTLAAYCLAHGLEMHRAAETELTRIWTKVEKIRAKQAAKPTGSALPQEWPALTHLPDAGLEAVAASLDKWADVLRDGHQIDGSITGLRDMSRVVRTALRSRPVGEVKVKPLVWLGTEKKSCRQANCTIGQYQVYWLGEFECWQLARPHHQFVKWKDGFSRHETRDLAMEAAQADYEARIRAALTEPSPATEGSANG